MKFLMFALQLQLKKVFNYIIVNTYSLFQVLISEKFKAAFVSFKTHKQVLIELALKKLEYMLALIYMKIRLANVDILH